ncbi:DMT family transporter [Paraburkholderia unamae]|uniref:Drug/metabolite transporter (DMT)-like permease n=1 Tax=Paraburkholderia unamae TaxID=219649 RepID=A0ABX5KSI3_9BURK|nr:DMT family transporter [Paraburkholderia unamae]PVX84462.1 drug/metabolite transporter (DMT)-like permease [Paraburkholderia unamae]
MRKQIDAAAVAIMVTLCLAWGLQQVALKAVAGDIPPVLQVGLRSGVAAALVWLFNRLVARERWLPGVARGAGLATGGLFALEFMFVAVGLRWTNASHMAVFLYTAPMFAAIGLHLRLPDERLTRFQWSGIALAFAGIAATFLGPALMGGGTPASPLWLLGDFMGVCAGAAWGLTTVVVRTSRLNDAPATQTLFYQLAGAFVVLVPVALVTGQMRFHGTPLAWASLAFQTLLVSFISYLAWFWLLRRYLAARLGVLSFMTPMFGVAMGVALLHERVEPAFLFGSAMVLLGLLVVNAQGWVRQAFGRRAQDTHGAQAS